MKLALIVDDLIQFGGAEKVFECVAEMYPDADIFTSVVSKTWTRKLAHHQGKIYTSFLQNFPFAVKLNRFYSFLLFHLYAFENFDLKAYDLVLSLSSRYAHHVITQPHTTHLCYMHSPGRMFWEPKNYFDREPLWAYFYKMFGFFLTSPLTILRISDFKAATNVDYFIANSKTSAARIKKYYNRESIVVYPFAEVHAPTQGTAGDFFLILTRLAAWKRVDIGIEACKKLGLNLKIVGKGPDLVRLKRLAGTCKNIEFFIDADDSKKEALLSQCTAVICTQHEDFGIVPIEAMLFGKTVIAFGKGGVLETVVKGVTGEFFYEQTSAALAEVLKSFDAPSYNSENCKKRAVLFSKQTFISNMHAYIDKFMYNRMTRV